MARWLRQMSGSPSDKPDRRAAIWTDGVTMSGFHTHTHTHTGTPSVTDTGTHSYTGIQINSLRRKYETTQHTWRMRVILAENAKHTFQGMV